MILRQFLHQEPVAMSYLLGCVGKGAGAVIDPVFPIEAYLQAAEALATPSIMSSTRICTPIISRLACGIYGSRMTEGIQVSA